LPRSVAQVVRLVNDDEIELALDEALGVLAIELGATHQPGGQPARRSSSRIFRTSPKWLAVSLLAAEAEFF
jgi:hypothetical protein